MNIETSNDPIKIDGQSYIRFDTNSTEAMRIDSSGQVTIGGSTIPTGVQGNRQLVLQGTGSEFIAYNPDNAIQLGDRVGAFLFANDDNNATEDHFAGMWAKSAGTTGAVDIHFAAGKVNYETDSPHMTLDYNGNLLVGKTALSGSTSGTEIFSVGLGRFVRNGGDVLNLNRLSSDGTIVDFQKDGTTVGSIGNAGAHMAIGTGDVGWFFAANIDAILPTEADGTQRDNAIDLGASAHRLDDIYATNGTIQTSDENEKQDIAELSDAEQRVAVAAKGLLRKFRWKDAVAEKGDEARTHFGIIAQDLQAAFAAEGLDAGDYAMFISSTWTDEETGEERTRMGVRYSELLAFIIAAI